MMDPEKILQERITHELDMDLLRKLQKALNVDLEKKIEFAERKFNDKMDRVIKNINNKNAHETGNI
jgi:hypothetical protein